MGDLVQMTSIGIDRLTDMMTFEQKAITFGVTLVVVLVLTFIGCKCDKSGDAEEPDKQADGEEK